MPGPSRLPCAQHTGAVGVLPRGCVRVGRGAHVCVYIGLHPGLLPGSWRKGDRLSICTAHPRGESAGPRARATVIAVPPTEAAAAAAAAAATATSHRHTSFPPREVTQPSRLFHDGKFGADPHRMDGLKILDCFHFSLNTLPFRKDYPPTGECGKSGGARQVG